MNITGQLKTKSYTRLMERQNIPQLDLNQINTDHYQNQTTSKSSGKLKQNISTTSHKKQGSKNPQYFTDRLNNKMVQAILFKDTETDRSPQNENYLGSGKSPITNRSSQKKSISFFTKAKRTEQNILSMLTNQKFQTERNKGMKKVNSTFIHQDNKKSKVFDIIRNKSNTSFTKQIDLSINRESVQSSKEVIHLDFSKAKSSSRGKLNSITSQVNISTARKQPLVLTQSIEKIIPNTNRQNSPFQKYFTIEQIANLTKKGFEKPVQNLNISLNDNNNLKQQIQQIISQSKIKNNQNNKEDKENQIQVPNCIKREEPQQEVSVHLKNLINFCNQSIQKKEIIAFPLEKTEPTFKVGNGKPPRFNDVQINLARDDSENTLETARFNQQDDPENKKQQNVMMYFDAVASTTLGTDSLMELVRSYESKKQSPPLIQINPQPQFKSKAMEKLFQSKSKSISPSSSDAKLMFSKDFKEKTTMMAPYKVLSEQLSISYMKKNNQDEFVMISEVSVPQSMEPDKASETQIKKQIQNLKGLRIRNERLYQITIPLMKCLFEQNLKYLNISSIGLQQGQLQISLVNLEYIDISDNQLEDLTAIQKCINLSEIQADKGQNRIQSLDGIQNLKLISILSLEFNQISNIDNMIPLKYNESMVAISLKENPVTKQPNYKRFLKQILPNLQYIDLDDQDAISNKIIFNDIYPFSKSNKRYMQFDEYINLTQNKTFQRD